MIASLLGPELEWAVWVQGTWRPDYDVYRLRSDRDQRDFTQWLLDRYQ